MTNDRDPIDIPLSSWEESRLATLHSLDLLDTPAEREFDAIVRLAQQITGSKIALISLIDRDRQWFKAKVGLDVMETPRELAFCSHALAGDDVLIVPDATKDERFCGNPLVTSYPHVRFYAGLPIRAKSIEAPSKLVSIGTLCVLDGRPRELATQEVSALVELSQLIETMIAARSATTAAVTFAKERTRNLFELDRKHRQLRQAERIANIGSWRLTLADNKAEWSEQTYAIHGIAVGDPEDLKAALDFYPPKARVIIQAALERTIATGEPFDVETDFTTAKGEYRRVRSMGELELDAGLPVALIGVFQDITARHAMEEALRKAAHIDELTGIANRARFNEYVDERLQVAVFGAERCALLLIDLDHFKTVNDQFGHHAGDDVLRAMASHLCAEFLPGCFAARLGGDEFVLFVTNQNALDDLPKFLRNLLGRLRHKITRGNVTLEVTATIGAAWLSVDVKTRSELLGAADAALYAAKKRRRGSAIIAGNSQGILRNGAAAPALKLVER